MVLTEYFFESKYIKQIHQWQHVVANIKPPESVLNNNYLFVQNHPIIVKKGALSFT